MGSSGLWGFENVAPVQRKREFWEEIPGLVNTAAQVGLSLYEKKLASDKFNQQQAQQRMLAAQKLLSEEKRHGEDLALRNREAAVHEGRLEADKAKSGEDLALRKAVDKRAALEAKLKPVQEIQKDLDAGPLALASELDPARSKVRSLLGNPGVQAHGTFQELHKFGPDAPSQLEEPRFGASMPTEGLPAAQPRGLGVTTPTMQGRARLMAETLGKPQGLQGPVYDYEQTPLMEKAAQLGPEIADGREKFRQHQEAQKLREAAARKNAPRPVADPKLKMDDSRWKDWVDELQRIDRGETDPIKMILMEQQMPGADKKTIAEALAKQREARRPQIVQALQELSARWQGTPYAAQFTIPGMGPAPSRPPTAPPLPAASPPSGGAPTPIQAFAAQYKAANPKATNQEVLAAFKAQGQR